MDAWSSIVLVVNILLLIAGWLLFQQAKSDLTARAAQVPVLGEVKALHRSIAALLEQVKLESGQVSAQLEARCLEARDLLDALDRRLEDSSGIKAASRPVRRKARPAEREISPAPHSSDSAASSAAPANASRYQDVYSLADGGAESLEIARQTGFSVGEVELILGLRQSHV